jgi:hypothetical protein
MSKINFNEICLNGFQSIKNDLHGSINECDITEKDGRSVNADSLKISLTDFLISQVFSRNNDK